MSERINLIHGDGGKHSKVLIEKLFYKYFNNELLLKQEDAAVFKVKAGKMAFTTDSFVVKPLFFPGGNIGKLAICGTINDLAVSGAKPLYLSAGFIIEEGFSMESLEMIVKAMGEEALKYDVKIVTGDTKVVDKGCVDNIFINTSGVGVILNEYETKEITPGDKIIVTGNIAEHGTTIALQRYNIKADGNLKSDCTGVFPIIEKIKEKLSSIKIMRDPTRGGVGTALHEFISQCSLGVHLYEEKIPISDEVNAVNQLLGLEPLYMACEGRMILVVDKTDVEEILKIIRVTEQGRDAKIVGEFIKEYSGNIIIENYFGGKRILSPLETNMLPRIC